MVYMDLTELLLAASQSADPKSHITAECELKTLHFSDVSTFLESLAYELSDEEKPLASRMLAGELLKNSLHDVYAPRKERLVEQWSGIDIEAKTRIKLMLLGALKSRVPEVSQAVRKVWANICFIDTAQERWPVFIEPLLKDRIEQTSPHLRQSALETLCYVCEKISQLDLLPNQVKAILTEVVENSMALSESPEEVRLAATKTLVNVLHVSQTTFENEGDRKYIMQVVYDTAGSKEAKIRQAAFECFVSIASHYYNYLKPHMTGLLELTLNAVKDDEESVALQAIEFWSSICDEELDRQEYDSPALPHASQLYISPTTGDSSLPYADVCFNFVKMALPKLVPILLETLKKQGEDQVNVWNMSMAGGTCLGLIAKTVGDSIIPLVMDFVKTNLRSSNWRDREAATYAYGSVLNGPRVDKLAPVVARDFETLLNAIEDENSQVRETVAWTLSRIFEFLHSTNSYGQSSQDLSRIVFVLLKSIKGDVPNVAEKVCGVIYHLVQGYKDPSSSSLLSPHLTNITTHLLDVAERLDGALSTIAYEALNVVVCLLEDSFIIKTILPRIMKTLNRTIY